MYVQYIPALFTEKESIKFSYSLETRQQQQYLEVGFIKNKHSVLFAY